MLLGDFGGERLGLEFETVLVEQTDRARNPLRAILTVKVASTGQSELGVNCRRLSLSHVQVPAKAGEISTPDVRRLFEVGERRYGFFEIHHERMDGWDAVLIVFGERGSREGIFNIVRLGPEMVPGEGTCGRDYNERANREAFPVRDHISPASAKLTADPRDPFGRLPLDVPEDSVEQPGYE